MGMMIACAKGCGEMLNITDEMIEQAKNSGVGLTVAHDVCPNDPAAMKRNFHIKIEVTEVVQPDDDICTVCHARVVYHRNANAWDHDGEPSADFDGKDHMPKPSGLMKSDLLASFGTDVHAASFKQALPHLQTALNERWLQVVGLANMVDAEDAEPDVEGTTGSEEEVQDGP